jgi:RimJ/RimL family protein N-acetyltransferase
MVNSNLGEQKLYELIPTVVTPRLLLRAFSLADAQEVQRLAGDKRIADTTVTIPHPYSLELARQWIGTHAQLATDAKALTFAMTSISTGGMVGAISLLNPRKLDSRTDLGYWVGVEHWRRGYCTEAMQALITCTHQVLGLTRFTAQCMASNVASSRVMQKCGLVHEGTLKRHLLKNGIYQDIDIYGLNFPERITKGIVQ